MFSQDSKGCEDQQPAPNHNDMFVDRLGGGCDELQYENGQRGDDRYVIDDFIKWPWTKAEGSNGKRDFDDDQQVGRRHGGAGYQKACAAEVQHQRNGNQVADSKTQALVELCMWNLKLIWVRQSDSKHARLYPEPEPV